MKMIGEVWLGGLETDYAIEAIIGEGVEVRAKLQEGVENTRSAQLIKDNHKLPLPSNDHLVCI